MRIYLNKNLITFLKFHLMDFTSLRS